MNIQLEDHDFIFWNIILIKSLWILHVRFCIRHLALTWYDTSILILKTCLLFMLIQLYDT